MRGMFDIDSPLMNVLNKAMNIVILNLCFIISCTSVITIGAAITAMYSVNLKMVRDEETYVFSLYWKAFRRNFIQSTMCWLLAVAAGLIVGIDFWFTGSMEGAVKNIFYVIMFVSMVVYSVIMIYVFPYMARFEDKLGTCIKNALVIGGANAGYTFAIMLIILASVAITFYNPHVMLRALFVWLICGFSLVSFINSFFLRKVFDKY
ncbi:MAG: YesL family protein [Lachnospiraceae bacterium]|nr:YesL family protein [Lachnospiraceae bacterium]